MKKENINSDCSNYFGWYNDYVVAFRNPLDMLSTNISKIVFDNIREEISPFTITVYPTQEPLLSKLNISGMTINLIVEILPNNAFLIGGSFDMVTKELDVNVKINKERFSEQFYNNLSVGIREAIRHEFEHARFQIDNPSHSPTYMEEEESDHFTVDRKIELAEDYLNDPSEIDSIIRQCMTNAKFNKTDFWSRLSSIVWYFLYTRSGIIHSIEEIQLRSRSNNQEAEEMLFRFNNILNNYRERVLVIYPEVFRSVNNR